uniref:Putative LOC100709668 [Oreochromis niloticus] n=1 Tax=Lepeophtheirus salmonis TaxID=72036 RepID=A0A0K2V5W7_LEPSM
MFSCMTLFLLQISCRHPRRSCLRPFLVLIYINDLPVF